MFNQNKTHIAKKLEREFSLIDAEVLHENYSCTIDWGREMSKPHQSILERKGFEITHEKEGIYTLEFDR